MALEKLRYGFLQIQTAAGVRYVQPRFGERVRLLWIFRNFSIISEPVLCAWQKRLVAALCAPERVLRPWRADEQPQALPIGTLVGAGVRDTFVTRWSDEPDLAC